MDSDLVAAAGNNIALGAIAGVIFTIAQCHNENQEANLCHSEFDPRKHLFFPVRYKKDQWSYTEYSTLKNKIFLKKKKKVEGLKGGKECIKFSI